MVPSHIKRNAVGVHLRAVEVKFRVDHRLGEDVKADELLVSDVVLEYANDSS